MEGIGELAGETLVGEGCRFGWLGKGLVFAFGGGPYEGDYGH